MSGSGSVTIGGGSSSTAVTLNNDYVSSHLAMFQSMTSSVASSGAGLYAATADQLLLVPDDSGSVAVIGAAGPSAVIAGDGASLDYVGRGNATIMGGDGDSTVVTGSGSDVIDLGTGHNQLFLGVGDNEIVSQGTDVIQAGGGNATVTVTGTDSAIYGGIGGTLSVDDSAGSGTMVYATFGTTVEGPTVAGATMGVYEAGDMTISGGAGSTAAVQVEGSLSYVGNGGTLLVTQNDSAGADVLYGENGASIKLSGDVHGNNLVANDAAKVTGGDVLFDGSQAAGGNAFWAGSGNATLIGGTGSDTLVGGTGASTLTGGGGGDQFDLFSVEGGHATAVTITDLGGSDALNLFGYGSAGVQYALAHSAQAGADTRMTLQDGSTITLQNFNQAHLATYLKS